MTRINKSRLSPMDKEKVMQNQRQMEEQIQQEVVSNSAFPPPPPPPPPPFPSSSSSSSSSSSLPLPPPPPPFSAPGATNTESVSGTSTVSEPKPHVAIYNPMAKRSTPVNAGTMDLPSSLIPNSVKKQVKEKAVTYNPFISSLPVSAKEETDNSKSEDKINVPGPQLRFTLVPYRMDKSDEEDSSEDESSEETKSLTEEKENEEQKEVNKKEEAFSQFMKEISSM